MKLLYEMGGVYKIVENLDKSEKMIFFQMLSFDSAQEAVQHDQGDSMTFSTE